MFARQVCGLLKLVARMLSRDNYAATMIELLGKILAPVIRGDGKRVFEASSEISDSTVAAATIMSKEGIAAMANQITAGIWRILTQNVDLLPLMSLEQWEIIFRIVAFGSCSGSYASFKSFEVRIVFCGWLALLVC